MGVRRCVSSWALALGLLENGSSKKLLIMNDINLCNTEKIENATKECGLQIQTIWKNNLEIEIEKDVDLTFIDTWHVYGQLKRELIRFGPKTKKILLCMIRRLMEYAVRLYETFISMTLKSRVVYPVFRLMKF